MPYQFKLVSDIRKPQELVRKESAWKVLAYLCIGKKIQILKWFPLYLLRFSTQVRNHKWKSVCGQILIIGELSNTDHGFHWMSTLQWYFHKGADLPRLLEDFALFPSTLGSPGIE